jgi:hypothetical protein
MATVQTSGGGQCLVEGAEHHREHHVEGPMKAANRVGEGPRVLGYGGRHPWMCELKQ